MTDTSEIHPQLLADCHRLGRLDTGWLLLHRNALIPWLILVPETEHTELLELTAEQQAALLADCSRLGALLKSHFGCDKLNFGALGNVVPQLHLHVVGRKSGDACWPAPVWGNLQQSRGHTSAELHTLQTALVDALGLQAANLSL